MQPLSPPIQRINPLNPAYQSPAIKEGDAQPILPPNWLMRRRFAAPPIVPQYAQGGDTRRQIGRRISIAENEPEAIIDRRGGVQIVTEPQTAVVSRASTIVPLSRIGAAVTNTDNQPDPSTLIRRRRINPSVVDVDSIPTSGAIMPNNAMSSYADPQDRAQFGVNSGAWQPQPPNVGILSQPVMGRAAMPDPGLIVRQPPDVMTSQPPDLSQVSVTPRVEQSITPSQTAPVIPQLERPQTRTLAMHGKWDNGAATFMDWPAEDVYPNETPESVIRRYNLRNTNSGTPRENRLQSGMMSPEDRGNFSIAPPFSVSAATKKPISSDGYGAGYTYSPLDPGYKPPSGVIPGAP